MFNMSAGKIKFLILKYVSGKKKAPVKRVTVRNFRMVQTDGSRQVVSDV